VLDRVTTDIAALLKSRGVVHGSRVLLLSDENLETVAELDDALKRLEGLSPRQDKLLQHRYFGGLTLEESATEIGVSLATAKRELRSARAWLALDLKGEPLG